MSAVLLNGRPAAGFELAAVEDARRCERERDLEQLAGVLSGDGRPLVPPHAPRPVTDLILEFS